jgi:hypothetical protein
MQDEAWYVAGRYRNLNDARVDSRFVWPWSRQKRMSFARKAFVGKEGREPGIDGGWSQVKLKQVPECLQLEEGSVYLY